MKYTTNETFSKLYSLRYSQIPGHRCSWCCNVVGLPWKFLIWLQQHCSGSSCFHWNSLLEERNYDLYHSFYLLCTIVTVFFSPVFSGFFLTPFLMEDIPLGMEECGLGLRMELTRGELWDRFIWELVSGLWGLWVRSEDLVITGSPDFLSSVPRDTRPALSSAAAI